jgi:hypothetical protein
MPQGGPFLVAWAFTFLKGVLMNRFTFFLVVGVFGLTGVFAQTTQTVSDKPLYPVALGHIHCADKLSVTIGESKKHAGHYDILIGKAHYEAMRIPTESGAVKLEDKKHGIVWLQMSNKSMLFNEKLAKRLATDCQSEAQKVVQKAMDAPATAVATSKP